MTDRSLMLVILRDEWTRTPRCLNADEGMPWNDHIDCMYPIASLECDDVACVHEGSDG